MKKIFFVFAILLLQLHFAYAHIGNSNVTFEGMAGPYHVLINIKPPDVIPGTAIVTVFANNISGLKITARPIYFNSGEKGAPAADVLTGMPGKPGQYETTLWLMNNGSASIELNVSGSLGKGQILVPVVAVTITTKKLPPSTKYMLMGLGIFLFILMITIVGASISDGITKIGQPVAVKNKNSKKIAFVVTAVLCSALVYGGNIWWNNVAKKTSQYLFKPMHATYKIENANGINKLHLTIDSANSQRSNQLPYVIPDHGKIMHLFLIRIPQMDVLAHLHPVREDAVNFNMDVPSLPAGKYIAYADIVYNSGFAETLKDTLAVAGELLNNNRKDSVRLDGDDVVDITNPLKNSNKPAQNITIQNETGEAVTMEDGTIILMKPSKEKNYFNNELCSLDFSVWDKTKQPLVPDLYMGMEGHAIIVRDDGLVFSHVHPVGTYSMAAQTSMTERIDNTATIYHEPDKKIFQDSVNAAVKKLESMPEKEREDYLMKEMNMGSGTSNSMPGMNMGSMSGMNMQKSNTVSFPYTFPTAGKYRIWVQIKKNGHIYTASFDRYIR